MYYFDGIILHKRESVCKRLERALNTKYNNMNNYLPFIIGTIAGIIPSLFGYYIIDWQWWVISIPIDILYFIYDFLRCKKQLINNNV